MLGTHKKLQSLATSGNGNAVQLNGLAREHVIYIYGIGTIAGGAVQLEEAHDKDYTGAWAAIGAAVTVVDATVKIVRITGCIGAVRARVSTNITGGGTVTVELYNNSGE